jgi:NADPH:quinone reductase-like Zn-dependent oxidoreductase
VWANGFSAFGVLGGHAERVAVPVANVVRSLAELDDAQAVSLLVNYNTMYFALARRAAIRPGDTIGSPTFDDAIRVLAIDGKLMVIGFAAGGIPTVKVNRLLLRNVSVVGVAWGEYLNQVPGSAALFSAGLGQLVSLGLKPPAPQRYPLSEAKAALQCLADGGVLGKLVLEP